MSEKLAQWIAWQLPPKVVYFAFIRFWAHATCTDEGAGMTPTEMTWDKAIDLWERKYGRI